jgi:CBS domain-containing protein
MRKHAIKRVPVCDDDGRLLGMLTRRDLLLEFVRPDEAVAADLAALWRDLSLPVNEPRSSVRDGIATIEGRLEHRAQAEAIIDRVYEVPGIVDVDDRLTWDDGDAIFAQGSVPWFGVGSVTRQAR